mmetsp:Transcript_2066/g.5229  ORF Transcript_2066/g.5229 Transcript_2066/m.5229 type:complete len:91 (-) Transcript_2066:1830-2102(-)
MQHSRQLQGTSWYILPQPLATSCHDMTVALCDSFYGIVGPMYPPIAHGKGKEVLWTTAHSRVTGEVPHATCSSLSCLSNAHQLQFSLGHP